MIVWIELAVFAAKITVDVTVTRLLLLLKVMIKPFFFIFITHL